MVDGFIYYFLSVYRIVKFFYAKGFYTSWQFYTKLI